MNAAWKWTVPCLATMLVVAVVGSSAALGRSVDRHGIGGGAFFGEPATLRALDLTANQNHAIRLALQTHWRSLRALAASDKAARHAIDDKLLEAGDVTTQDVEGLIQEELRTHDALTHERVAAALDLRKALTPDQIRQVASIRAGVAQMHAGTHRLATKPLGPQ
jgi:Spy/CpxP family protein refolding chaperone